MVSDIRYKDPQRPYLTDSSLTNDVTDGFHFKQELCPLPLIET